MTNHFRPWKPTLPNTRFDNGIEPMAMAMVMLMAMARWIQTQAWQKGRG
jgi:hypothetical protein